MLARLTWVYATWLLALALLAQGKAIGDLFNVFTKGNGRCSTLDQTVLNAYVTDVQLLLASVQAAESAALQQDSGGSAGRNSLVARRLYTTWFGIQFTNAVGATPTVTSETKQIWDDVKDVFDSMLTFVSTGSVNGPGIGGTNNILPWLACSGVLGNVYPWNAQAMDSSMNPITINGQGVAIQDLIPQKSLSVPIYFTKKRAYILGGSYYPNGDWCAAYVDPETGEDKIDLAITTYGSNSIDKYIDGRRIYYSPMSPGMVICPVTFEGDVDTLSDVEWYDPSDKMQISEVLSQGSGTLFHEFAHLVSYWGSSDTGTWVHSQKYVEDISYDAKDCLQLAEGKLADHAASESPLNAETYLFFAFSYWYYQQDWGSGKTAGTFYPGYAVNWNWKNPSS